MKHPTMDRISTTGGNAVLFMVGTFLEKLMKNGKWDIVESETWWNVKPLDKVARELLDEYGQTCRMAYGQLTVPKSTHSCRLDLREFAKAVGLEQDNTIDEHLTRMLEFADYHQKVSDCACEMASGEKPHIKAGMSIGDAGDECARWLHENGYELGRKHPTYSDFVMDVVTEMRFEVDIADGTLKELSIPSDSADA